MPAKTNPSDKVGTRMRRLREKRGWSLRRLAQESGVSHVYIHNLENGSRSSVSLNHAVSIAHAFGMTVSELIGEKSHGSQPGANGTGAIDNGEQGNGTLAAPDASDS